MIELYAMLIIQYQWRYFTIAKHFAISFDKALYAYVYYTSVLVSHLTYRCFTSVSIYRFVTDQIDLERLLIVFYSTYTLHIAYSLYIHIKSIPFVVIIIVIPFIVPRVKIQTENTTVQVKETTEKMCKKNSRPK